MIDAILNGDFVMHISDVEKARMEKDHQMRNGYQVQNNNRFPHSMSINEHQYVNKDTENKHARESQPSDYQRMMERVK
jgi:hypothetical protein